MQRRVLPNSRGLRRFIQLLATIVVISMVASFANGIDQETEIVLWNRNFDTAPVDKVLQLAFTKTLDLYFPLTIKRSDPVEQNVAIRRLQEGEQMHVVSTAASATREQKFHTVGFPVLKGLLGIRVCLIRKGEQNRFSTIETPYDFISRDFRICQSSYWPDVEVLRRNGFHTVTKDRYQDLFTGLANNDCDCILRGVQEIIPEAMKYQASVDIEEDLVFKYFQPGLFYVNQSSPQLASRIELGLLRALDDGSYDELIVSLLGPSLTALKLSDRLSFQLINPNLSPKSRALTKQRAFWHESVQ